MILCFLLYARFVQGYWHLWLSNYCKRFWISQDSLIFLAIVPHLHNANRETSFVKENWISFVYLMRSMYFWSWQRSHFSVISALLNTGFLFWRLQKNKYIYIYAETYFFCFFLNFLLCRVYLICLTLFQRIETLLNIFVLQSTRSIIEIESAGWSIGTI